MLDITLTVMSESLGAFTKVSNLCFILGFFFVYLYFMLFKYSS